MIASPMPKARSCNIIFTLEEQLLANQIIARGNTIRIAASKPTTAQDEELPHTLATDVILAMSEDTMPKA